MTETVAHNLRIDSERLWDSLMTSAKFGATENGGICRLALSDHDRAVRDWFKAKAEEFGCAVAVDDMGVMYARRPGRRPDVPPIAMGSHLDTQPTGGKFDGILGVLGALEVLRTLHETGYETHAPIEVINWTNEEGSRFAPAMMASGVFAGIFERAATGRAVDAQGISFDDAIDAIGYRGAEACGEHPLSAYFELHIEQGPILENESFDIGVVAGVQGIRWYDVKFTGQAAHAGTTPMPLRKNALVGAADLVQAVDRIARAHAPNGVSTIGVLNVHPSSRNVIPGDVDLSVDLRHPEIAVLGMMEDEMRQAVAEIAKRHDLGVEIERIWEQAPLGFDPDCVAAVRESAKLCGYSSREMTSGAGHDAVNVSRVAPSAMIFIPSGGGLSHNEAEFSTQEQCAKGTQVLLQAVLRYDQMLAETKAA